MLPHRFYPQPGDIVEVITGTHHGVLYTVAEIVNHRARLERSINDYRDWEDEANMVVRCRPGVI
jgi:hypothetical protein